jgi:hypothetical protein
VQPELLVQLVIQERKGYKVKPEPLVLQVIQEPKVQLEQTELMA